MQIRPIKNITYATEALYRVLGELMMWLHYNMLRLSGKWVINKDERSISIEKLHVWTHVIMIIHKKTTLFLEPIYYQNIFQS